jgi:3D-(3,5/4)-trihydroxycyclohexane-1,2-dione acylhydrolase (decyclizing)
VAFAEAHGVPVVETVAGRTLVAHDHPLYAGALGIVGSTSANTLAAEADVVVAVGTRLQDFTTSSWTGFSSSVRLVSLNAARFDAVKHGAQSVVGDARETLVELSSLLGDWTAPAAFAARAATVKAEWDDEIDRLRAGGLTPDGSLTYAQLTGAVNDASGPDDYVLTASGGMPGELHGGWRTGKVAPGATSGATMDLEYGFSCMGYEVVAPWGAAMARTRTHPDGVVTSIFGDGSYLMLNSELYSATLAGDRLIVVLCDNGGYAVIHRLQVGQGGAAYNNMLEDVRPGYVPVDWVGHATSLGCHAERVATVAELEDAFQRARGAERTAVIVIRTAPHDWTPGGAFWEVGVPQVSSRAEVREARERLVESKQAQRIGW